MAEYRSSKRCLEATLINYQSGRGPGKGTTMKSEIRGLEYAVVALVHTLDILLTAELGLRLLEVGKGLHISTPDHLNMAEDAFVTIRPTGWPKESFINARFIYGTSGWKLYEGGEIWANHVPIPVSHLHFEPLEGGLGVCLKPVGEDQCWHVTQAHIQLIASLQRDVLAHQE